MILFKNVTKAYGEEESFAIENINLKIEDGEFVVLVGQSGAGKSTLMKLIIGEQQPDKGEVFLGKTRVNDLRYGDMPRHRKSLGIIFQDFKLLPSKTAFENIAFAMEILGKDNLEISRKVPRFLNIVGMGSKANKFPSQMSGGERQRIAIARALINEPKVLLADEPTGNLDVFNSWDIVNLLLKINEQLKTTVIFATHNKEVVNSINKRVISLDKGKIIRDSLDGKYII
ncbi:MAG: ATP-binding cassette domain-containing protein [Candidatus Paceibacterota bacterium]